MHHRLLLEYDSERAGTFEPLRFVSKSAVAVLGLVSTKTTEIESKDAMRARGLRSPDRAEALMLAFADTGDFDAVLAGF